MTNFDSIQLARNARKNSEFAEAEAILLDALRSAESVELREALLRQLFFVYFSPLYEHLEEAESCLEQIEKLNPSAENALE
jgi:hypothetical protein